MEYLDSQIFVSSYHDAGQDSVVVYRCAWNRPKGRRCILLVEFPGIAKVVICPNTVSSNEQSMQPPRREQFLARIPTTQVWCLAVVARVLTKLYGESWLATRPELVVAHNSFRRLVDGVHMRRNGFSPYEGDMLHCVFDLIIAELLRKIASLYVENNERVEKSKVEQICSLVEKFYLFNPLVIATCAICSLSVVYNLLITMFLLSFVKGWLIGSAVLCGLLVELTLYPVSWGAVRDLHSSFLFECGRLNAERWYFLNRNIVVSENARWTLVIAVSWVTCVVLSPVMWQMWIVTGSGNANFYFAVTLCYSMAQTARRPIFLMTDLLYSHLREKAAEERGSIAYDDTSLFVFK
uniref:Uncharacterized protein n=1 Tax=Parascaris equorum TaxID=6256 RepID=A0A914RP53_PAREQ